MISETRLLELGSRSVGCILMPEDGHLLLWPSGDGNAAPVPSSTSLRYISHASKNAKYDHSAILPFTHKFCGGPHFFSPADGCTAGKSGFWIENYASDWGDGRSGIRAAG